MIWHIFNFTVNTIMIIFDRITDIISYRELEADPTNIDSYRFEYFSLLVSDIQVFFSFYGVMFLLYLIVRFSNSKDNTKVVKDE